MSRCIRRSALGFVPLLVFVGQTATAFGDLTALETSDTRLTETSIDSTSSSEEKSSSKSPLLLLLAGGALLSFGMGGSGGSDSFVSRSTADGRSLVNPPAGSGTGFTDILIPQTPQPDVTNTLPSSSNPSDGIAFDAANGSDIVNSAPDLTPVFVDGNEFTAGSPVPSFVAPTDTARPPVTGSTGNNSGNFPSPGAPTSVPEPSAVLLGSSLIGAGLAWRLRRKKA